MPHQRFQRFDFMFRVATAPDGSSPIQQPYGLIKYDYVISYGRRECLDPTIESA